MCIKIKCQVCGRFIDCNEETKEIKEANLKHVCLCCVNELRSMLAGNGRRNYHAN